MQSIRLPDPLTDNIHANEIRALFGGSLSAQVRLRDHINFAFICFTNRCGSNYLAQLLAATGRLNLADDAMHWEEVGRVTTRWNLRSFQQYFAVVMERNARSGWFLTKLAIAYLPLLQEAGLLDRCFRNARFIHITRDDTLDQAISLEIALQNQRWASFLAAAKPDEALEFSAPSIAMHRERFREENSMFETLFAANGIVPARVTYEALAKDPAGTLDRLAPLFGFETLRPDLVKVTTARQAGAINRRWRELFLAAGSGTAEP
jgi:LPS sulfotransferase NodH